MKTSPDYKKSLALSLTLHAGVFGGMLALDEPNQVPDADMDTLHDIVERINTSAVKRLTLKGDRETIMSTYGAEVFIPLEGEINEDSANRFKRNFQNANQGYANDYFVTVSTNSGGGYVYSGYEIANEINNSPVPTRILCTQQAASMAAMILITTANVFTRDATNDCNLMLHAPYDRIELGDKTVNLKISDYALAEELIRDNSDGQFLGVPYSVINENGLYDVAYLEMTLEQIEESRRSLETLSAAFVKSIAENSRLTEHDVTLLFEKGEVYLNAFEARFLGLIDHIEGAQMDEINALVSEISVCTNHPEISLCREEPSLSQAPQF